MKIEKLATPAILLDLDVLAHNISKYQDMCDLYDKELWPMVKTHKSTVIAKMQAEAGAAGFLCGTLDECEALCAAGYENLMYAYPVADPVSIARVIELSRRCNFHIRLDTLEAAAMVDAAAREAGIIVNYTLIVDCGLHRFGVAPDKVGEIMAKLDEFENLEPCGISTHPGAVYAAEEPRQVPLYARAESAAMEMAAAAMEQAVGFPPDMVTSGSTPTFAMSLDDPNIGIYHPGNYVFNDVIQMANGTAGEDECALTVLASVISHPGEGRFLIDAGAKCLGLDQGAHGNAAIVGFGRVVGHPELIVTGLSEEVGKITVAEGETTDLKVGDRICIIPNHACSTANLTDRYVGVRGDEAVELIPVDIRGNRCAWELD